MGLPVRLCCCRSPRRAHPTSAPPRAASPTPCPPARVAAAPPRRRSATEGSECSRSTAPQSRSERIFRAWHTSSRRRDPRRAAAVKWRRYKWIRDLCMRV
ncbi:hypothetical protein SETIT_4G240400v2 [Setaria italica]|uniref:Uncharacterized protein n=1 Tax=Setaria italica TaxID=4555 RepID=A0A368QXM9_SETIT|nr:hypothetical protein SETIT_4G240400v2 [Setaria italica]